MTALDQENEDSAYDFIYVDNRRVAQYLSQFSQFGHLTGLTRVDGKTQSGGGGVNVGAAKIDKSTTTQRIKRVSLIPSGYRHLIFWMN